MIIKLAHVVATYAISGVAKAQPGQARARPKFVPVMSCDLARSACEC